MHLNSIIVVEHGFCKVGLRKLITFYEVVAFYISSNRQCSASLFLGFNAQMISFAWLGAQGNPQRGRCFPQRKRDDVCGRDAMAAGAGPIFAFMEPPHSGAFICWAANTFD